jgi:NADPH2:quinone reductase
VRALTATSFDEPAAIEFADLPEPDALGKVLIAVAAAGLGFPDLLVAKGGYQVRPDLPFVPGMEVVGTVLSAPDSGLVGRRVTALTGVTGGCAERVAVRPEHVFAIPRSVPTDIAGGFVVNHHTAWFALVTRAALQPGETVLVHGAGGGLGQAVCGVATALGARVVGVVSSAAKARAATAAGAAATVVTSEHENWPDAVRRSVRSVDLVVDPVGGARVDESIRLLSPLGRLVVVGFASGEIASVRINRLLLRNVTVLGAAWREYVESHPDHGQQIARGLDGLVEAGRLQPSVGRVYDWKDAGAAFEGLVSGQALGRTVIRMPPAPHG